MGETAGMERYAAMNYAFLPLPGLHFLARYYLENLLFLGAFLFPLLLYFTKQTDLPLLVHGIKYQRPHFETLPHFLAPNPGVLKCGM